MEVGPGQSEEEAVTCTEVVQSEGKSSSLSCEEVVLYRPHDDVITLGADLSWCVRLLSVCVRGVSERYLSAWWSTLGGAYSALGDINTMHAVQAGVMSRHQLALAHLIGDPVMISRCQLFLAFSLLQQGKLKRAAAIIREQYRFATTQSTVHDQKLVDMCLSAWSRLTELRNKHSTPQLTYS